MSMLHRPAAALGDGGVEHRLELGLGNVEAVLEGVDPLGQRAGTGHQRLDPRQDGIICRQRLQIGSRREQAEALVGE
jgi:hypothetical protein